MLKVRSRTKSLDQKLWQHNWSDEFLGKSGSDDASESNINAIAFLRLESGGRAGGQACAKCVTFCTRFDWSVCFGFNSSGYNCRSGFGIY